MKLVLLGTGGYYANDRRHTACLMLPEIGIVLDAGSAMYRVGELLSTDSLDIFLTHVHLDHVVGLTYLLDVLPGDVLCETTIHGESEKLAAVREHLFAEAIFPVTPPFQFAVLKKDFELPGGGTLRHFPLKHPGGSVGYRLDWPDRSLAYVTDTTAAPNSSYLEHIRGADVLVHEAYFADDQDDRAALTGHSCVMDVAQVAAEAQVGCLILVHVNPSADSDGGIDVERVRGVFPNTMIGSDRMEIEF
jgi:ribonuclease Z